MREDSRSYTPLFLTMVRGKRIHWNKKSVAKFRDHVKLIGIGIGVWELASSSATDLHIPDTLVSLPVPWLFSSLKSYRDLTRKQMWKPFERYKIS
jgi:hypothetical protein